jgi:hypothetical protein
MARSGVQGDNPDESYILTRGSSIVLVVRVLLLWCAVSMLSAPALGALLARLQQPLPPRQAAVRHARLAS